MKIKHFTGTAVLALIVLGSVAIGADTKKTYVLTQSSELSLTPVQAEQEKKQEKSDSASSEAPLTREQILKLGPEALEKNCIGCHLADKWEGTNRDRNGWAAIVEEMSKLMDDAEMPHMNDKTFNLIVDYLALTRPQ